MPQRTHVLLMIATIVLLQGCGSGSDIAALQQQVAALATQVEDTRKDMDVMRQTNQELGNLVTALQTEVSGLRGEDPSALPGVPANADTPPPEVDAPSVKDTEPTSPKARAPAESEAEVAPVRGAEIPALPDVEAPAPPETETPPVLEAAPVQKEAAPRPKKVTTPAIPPTKKSTPTVSCAQVWREVGKGKDVEEIAQALNTTVDAVQACDEGIGRGGR